MRPRLRYDANGDEYVEWWHRHVQVDAAEVPPDRRSLVEGAALALRANRAYLHLATPTPAQALEQVDRLTRQMQAVIRLSVGWVDLEGDESDVVPPVLPVPVSEPPRPGRRVL